MLRFSAGLLALSAAIGALACGRSALKIFGPQADEGGGGAGGVTTTTTSSATTTTTTTTTGSGGTGGSCPVEVQLSAPRGIAGGDGFHQRQPRLSYSSNDRQRVTVACERVATEGPGPMPSELHHTSFEPWQSWTEADLEPSFVASPNSGVSFAAAPAANNLFALALSDGGNPPPPAGVALMRQLTPGSGTVPPVQMVDSFGVDVLALSMQTGAASAYYGAHLVVYSAGDPSVEARARVAIDSIGLTQPVKVGCGLERVAATATARATYGWLVAVSTSSTGCEPSPGLATQIDFGLADESGTVGMAAHYGPGGTVVRLDSAPHPDGAWMAWTTTSGLVQLTRIDTEGFPVLDVLGLNVPDEQIVTDSLAITTASIGALVVYGVEGPAMRWMLVENDGSVCASERVDGALPTDLIANPNGQGALLSSVRSTPSGDRAELLRITVTQAL